MRTLLLAALLASAACVPNPNGVASRADPMSSQAPVTESGGESAAQAASESGESIAPTERPDTGAQASSASCVYEPSSRRYAQCAHFTGDGTCAAYGAWCGPADLHAENGNQPCMFHELAGRYERCTHVTTDGRCAAYGAWCGPKEMRREDGGPPCMFDPADAHLKACNHVTDDGHCTSYGSWCQP